MRKQICMVTTSPLDYDSRILNEAGTLAKHHDLTILAKSYFCPSVLKKTPFKVKRVVYMRLWPHFFDIISALVSLTIVAFKENPDVYHAHDLDGLLCAYLPAAIKKKKLIYDSHELWSDLSSAKRMRIQGLLRILERVLMRGVERGITVNDALAKILEKKYHKKFESIYNYPKLSAKGGRRYHLREEFPGCVIILHVGTVSRGRGVENLIEASRFLPLNFVTIFLGSFNTGHLADLVEEKKLDKKVFFKPSITPDEVITASREADIGVVLTQNLALSYYYSLPNKLFQYIAAETPILASNLPEQKKIVLQNKIGEVVDPAKPRQIAVKIIKMAEAQNQKTYRGHLKNLAQNKYNWAMESKKLLNFYRNL